MPDWTRRTPPRCCWRRADVPPRSVRNVNRLLMHLECCARVNDETGHDVTTGLPAVAALHWSLEQSSCEPSTDSPQNSLTRRPCCCRWECWCGRSGHWNVPKNGQLSGSVRGAGRAEGEWRSASAAGGSSTRAPPPWTMRGQNWTELHSNR